MVEDGALIGKNKGPWQRNIVLKKEINEILFGEEKMKTSENKWMVKHEFFETAYFVTYI